MKRIVYLYLFLSLIVAALLAGCSDSNNDFVASTGGGGGNVNAGPTAQVTVQHVLLRSVPARVVNLRFTGTDSNGNTVYGPVTQAKAAQITLTVPITVANLQIEYLEGGVVIGIYQQAVNLTAGGTLTINDPSWVSVAGPLASTLNFLAQPVSTTLGETLPAIQVEILDQFGNRFEVDGPINLSLTTNSGGGLLSGTTTVNAVGGLATFSDLSVTVAGTGYTLTANGAGLTPFLSQQFNIVIRALSGTLGLARLCPTGYGPIDIAADDFNGDGFTDLAVSTAYSNGGVSVLLGNADGGFNRSAELFGNFGRSTAIAAGDVNGDTFVDLVLGDRSRSFFSIFPGVGDGTFQAPISIDTGYYNRGLALGDFDGTNGLDVLITSTFNLSGSSDGNQAELWLNDGAGNFARQGKFTTGTRPSDVAVGQLNPRTDMFLDAVVTNPNGNTVSVCLGDGTGGFTVTNIGTGSSARSTSIADLNTDGYPDLVVPIDDNNTVQIRLGDGFGAFPLTQTLNVGSSPHHVGIANINADMNLDLAVAVRDTNTIEVYEGDGTGGFTKGPIVPAGESPVRVLPLDFNRDGAVDLIGAALNDSAISLIPNQGGGTFPNQSDLNPNVDTRFVLSGDFNGDRHADVVSAEGLSNQLSFFPGNGDGTFGGRVAVSSGGTRPAEIATADFNRDNIPDVVLVNQRSNNAVVFLNDGAGNFTLTTTVGTDTDPDTVAAGDLNGDGFQDFAVGHRSEGRLTVFFGDGTGAFPTSQFVANQRSVRTLRLGDMNRDGRLDIVASDSERYGNNSFNDRLLTYLNEGSGTFAAPIPSSFGLSDPRYLSLGDIDQDGDLDAVLLTRQNDLIGLYTGDGTGALTLGNTLASASIDNDRRDSHVVELADVNGDRLLDILSADQGGSFQILLNKGQGNFQISFQEDNCLPLAGASPFHLTTADFNEDGRPDFAIGSHREGGSSTVGGISIILQPPPTP